MLKRISIGTGLVVTAAALAGSVAFAQSPTTTVSPSPEQTVSPTMSPSPTMTLPGGAPATGRGE